MTLHTVTLTVNGMKVSVEVEPRNTLADILRSQLGLTGTHLGCEHGVCGACTVIVDGEPARSCLMLGVQAEGTEVLTVEGVSPPEGLSLIQKALHEHHGLQCGFCTPGMVMALHHLFSVTSSPSEEEIKESISGQLCRCTGYQGIVSAAKAVAQKQQASQSHDTTVNGV